MPEGVYSIGRAGSYLYGIDIDDCIRQSMIIAKELLEGGQNILFLVRNINSQNLMNNINENNSNWG